MFNLTNGIRKRFFLGQFVKFIYIRDKTLCQSDRTGQDNTAELLLPLSPPVKMFRNADNAAGGGKNNAGYVTAYEAESIKLQKVHSCTNTNESVFPVDEMQPSQLLA